jgi:hypothetical protein
MKFTYIKNICSIYSKTFNHVLANARDRPSGAEGKEQPVVAPPVTTLWVVIPCGCPFQKLSFKKSFYIYILKSIQ